MVDSISTAPGAREIGASQSRKQASPGASSEPENEPPVSAQHMAILQAAVEQLIEKSLPNNSRLQITRDDATGTFIYRSIDPDTGQVVGQYPAEDVIRLREYLRHMEGLLLDTKV